jgi:transcriptional regulator with XRE-family HTH domain
MERGATTFGRLLRRFRHAAWLTQEELAEKSGLSPRTIQGIERGQVNRPHRESVRLLADALSLEGVDRTEFEAAARRDSATGQDCVRCDELAERLRDLTRVLDSMGYGVAGARVSDHTLPVQVLPGA